MNTKNSFLSQLEIFQVRNQSVLSKERVVSVDALRGFDMFWIMGGEMVFIGLDKVFHNRLTGFIKTQLDHVPWFGFHFYDIIMPLFLFLVGVSMVYSYRKRLENSTSDKAIWTHTIKRVIILWILGMMVQGNLLSYNINQFQLYSNTLQAIASGYLIATIIVLYMPVLYQILVTVGLMLIYWAILALVPINGSTIGDYTPAGNVANIFDAFILGRFEDGLDYSWIISSLNFGATTMLGVFSGYIMQSHAGKIEKLRRYIIYGLSLIVIALIWDYWHPIIKRIWTSTFVLYSGGICVLMLAFFYLLIDIWGIRKGLKLLIIIGSNAITAYVAWHLFNGPFIQIAETFINGIKPQLGNWFESLRYLGGFLVLYFILWYMYKNKTFIKI